MSAIVDEVPLQGTEEPAFLISPESGPTRAAVLFLHWFDEAPNANRTQFVDEAVTLAETGAVSLLPQLSFPWGTPPAESEADLRRIEAEMTALRSGIELLSSRGELPLAVVGHDFGAMYGALLMAEVEPACGVMIAATPRWADWFLPFWPIAGDRFDYMRSLDPVDPVNAVSRVTAPLLFQFGKQDFYIAPMTGLELFRSANDPKTIETYDAGHEMELESIREDRARFLVEHLGLGEDQ